ACGPLLRTCSSAVRERRRGSVCCPRTGRWSPASGKRPSGCCEMSGLLTTPTESLGAPRRERVIIEDRTFLIDRPTDTSATLEPAGGAAGRYMPYWVDLWPAARMLAKWSVKQSWPQERLRAVEGG